MKISVILEALTGSYETDLARASKATDKRMREIEKSAVRVGKVIGTALVAGVTAVGVAVKSAIDRADTMSKTAQKIGITTEALSRLGYAAELADVDLATLQAGLKKLTVLQTTAAQGGDEAARTFSAFGIAIKDSEGNLRDTMSVLADFSNVFATLPDGPEKTALAVRVFGKAGAELIPLLNEGASGLKELAAEADRLGITISGATGKAAEEFNDNLTRLEAQVKGAANEIAAKLLPELLKLSKAFLDTGEDSNGFADFIVGNLEAISKKIRGTAVEIEFLKKAWKEQGLFGDGILKTLSDANTEFERREALADGLAIHGGPRGRGTARKGTEQGRIAREAGEAAKKLLASEKPDTGAASKAAAAAKRAAAEAAREQADAERELAEKVKEADDAQKQFTTTLEDLEAQMSGPVAVAQLEYARKEKEITELHKNSATPNAEELQRALDALANARDKEVAAIEKSLHPGRARIEQMREELRILGLKSQAERDAADFKNQYADATDADAAEAAALAAQLDAKQRLIQLNDEIRQSFADNFESLLNGTKSLKDAFSDFADSVIQSLTRIVAQNFAAKIFGDPGTAGGGWLGSLLGGGEGSLLSGFFASGTNYAPGGLAMVGEQGPEVVALPRGSKVIPNHALQGMGGKTVAPVINITVPGNTTRETAQQIAMKVAQAVSFAGRAA